MEVGGCGGLPGQVQAFFAQGAKRVGRVQAACDLRRLEAGSGQAAPGNAAPGNATPRWGGPARPRHREARGRIRLEARGARRQHKGHRPARIPAKRLRAQATAAAAAAAARFMLRRRRPSSHVRRPLSGKLEACGVSPGGQEPSILGAPRPRRPRKRLLLLFHGAAHPVEAAAEAAARASLRVRPDAPTRAVAAAGHASEVEGVPRSEGKRGVARETLHHGQGPEASLEASRATAAVPTAHGSATNAAANTGLRSLRGLPPPSEPAVRVPSTASFVPGHAV
mmetsp:Transcript_50952/g.115795  ORF Transcript_50952/g.115795 Transcript_50952/m.115795 type:complete len:281 (+) Transcript_50952:474-1316(+)